MDAIKEQVTSVLDKAGVLARLKAELRASVFTAINEQDLQQGGGGRASRGDGARREQLAADAAGQLLLQLVHDFLAWAKLQFTLQIYVQEAPASAGARGSLAQQLGLPPEAADEAAGPLLLQLLHQHAAVAQQQQQQQQPAPAAAGLGAAAPARSSLVPAGTGGSERAGALDGHVPAAAAAARSSKSAASLLEAASSVAEEAGLISTHVAAGEEEEEEQYAAATFLAVGPPAGSEPDDDASSSSSSSAAPRQPLRRPVHASGAMQEPPPPPQQQHPLQQFDTPAAPTAGCAPHMTQPHDSAGMAAACELSDSFNDRSFGASSLELHSLQDDPQPGPHCLQQPVMHAGPGADADSDSSGDEARSSTSSRSVNGAPQPSLPAPAQPAAADAAAAALPGRAVGSLEPLPSLRPPGKLAPLAPLSAARRSPEGLREELVRSGLLAADSPAASALGPGSAAGLAAGGGGGWRSGAAEAADGAEQETETDSDEDGFAPGHGQLLAAARAQLSQRSRDGSGAPDAPQQRAQLTGDATGAHVVGGGGFTARAAHSSSEGETHDEHEEEEEVEEDLLPDELSLPMGLGDEDDDAAYVVAPVGARGAGAAWAAGADKLELRTAAESALAAGPGPAFWTRTSFEDEDEL